MGGQPRVDKPDLAVVDRGGAGPREGETLAWGCTAREWQSQGQDFIQPSSWQMLSAELPINVRDAPSLPGLDVERGLGVSHFCPVTRSAQFMEPLPGHRQLLPWVHPGPKGNST